MTNDNPKTRYTPTAADSEDDIRPANRVFFRRLRDAVNRNFNAPYPNKKGLSKNRATVAMGSMLFGRSVIDSAATMRAAFATFDVDPVRWEPLVDAMVGVLDGLTGVQTEMAQEHQTEEPLDQGMVLDLARLRERAGDAARRCCTNEVLDRLTDDTIRSMGYAAKIGSGLVAALDGVVEFCGKVPAYPPSWSVFARTLSRAVEAFSNEIQHLATTATSGAAPVTPAAPLKAVIADEVPTPNLDAYVAKLNPQLYRDAVYTFGEQVKERLSSALLALKDQRKSTFGVLAAPGSPFAVLIIVDPEAELLVLQARKAVAPDAVAAETGLECVPVSASEQKPSNN